jgi:hypothetical protein
MKAGKIVHLTDLEERLLALLPEDGRRVSTADLVRLYFRGELEPPINANTIVRGRLDMIARKLRHNGDRRIIHKSNRAGPHPVEFWIEKAA